jgi:hypothetical protein
MGRVKRPIVAWLGHDGFRFAQPILQAVRARKIARILCAGARLRPSGFGALPGVLLAGRFGRETAPVFFVRAPGTPVFPVPSSPLCVKEGMERRAALPIPPCGGRVLAWTRRHSALHLRRFRSPAPFFRAGRRGRAHSAPLIRRASARLRSRRVQPLKADPPSGAGRLAGASRERGYEPRPRAPRRPKRGFPPSGPWRGAAASPAALLRVAPSS